MWLYCVLLFHISIFIYCYTALCSSVRFSQTNCGFKSKGRDSQAHSNYCGFLGLYFSAHRYWVVNLSLQLQKKFREKNCGAFYFSLSELIVIRDSHFLIVHTGPAWASWSELLNKLDTPASCRGSPKEWEVRKLNMTFCSEPTYGLI